MEYTWLVERIPAIQTLRQILGIGYVDAVVKYNEIIEFLDSVGDSTKIEQKGIDSLEFVIFMLRREKVLDFKIKDDDEYQKDLERLKIIASKDKKAQEWFNEQTDFDKEMINHLIEMNQVGPAMG